MCQLFETIKVLDGQVCRLSDHQQRVSRDAGIDLLAYINKHVDLPAVGLHKLRITYTETNVCHHSVEPYVPKKVESLRLVIGNRIDYHKKFENRSNINVLMDHKGECDDILIIKNKLVTDISFANILFFADGKWVTPDTPLLEGTCRARLMAQNIVFPQTITVSDLELFSKFMIINAMLDFDPERAVEYSFKAREIIAVRACVR